MTLKIVIKNTMLILHFMFSKKNIMMIILRIVKEL